MKSVLPKVNKPSIEELTIVAGAAYVPASFKDGITITAAAVPDPKVQTTRLFYIFPVYGKPACIAFCQVS